MPSNFLENTISSGCVRQPDRHAPDSSIVFFDDHQNKIRRLMLSRERGFRHIIFDDNMPFPYTHISLAQVIAGGYSAELEKIIDTYDVMPPLWDIHHHKGIDVPGLNIEGLDDIKPMFYPVDYSWITYVRLR